VTSLVTAGASRGKICLGDVAEDFDDQLGRVSLLMTTVV
jgi:hypothetical protein